MDITRIGNAAAYAPPPARPAASPGGDATAAPTPNAQPGSETSTATSAATTQSTNTHTTPSEQQKASEELKKSVQVLNDFIAPHTTSLNFSIDEDTGSVVVKVTDTETDKVIKQIPSKEALELAKALDKLRGLLVKQEA